MPRLARVKVSASPVAPVGRDDATDAYVPGVVPVLSQPPHASTSFAPVLLLPVHATIFTQPMVR
jgi:hypothetical protein